MRQVMRRKTAKVILIRMAGVLVLLLAFGHPGAAQSLAADTSAPASDNCDWSGQTYTDFYQPPDLGPFTPDRLGEVLRVEHIQSYTAEEVAAELGVPTSPYGAEAYRILYISQEAVGAPLAVSGLIVLPVGTMPSGGYPVIIDGHPTVGAADICAPSRSPARPLALFPYVNQGYIVASTDYAGLGTPGPHPYVIGDVAAHNMLDMGRAARRFCDAGRGIGQNAANRMLLEGHSQGGHSALFAEQEMSTYSPDLQILGTIAFAPGSEPKLLAETMAQSNYSALVGPTAIAMNAMSQYYGQPTDPSSWLLEPYASELASRMETQCVYSTELWLGLRPERVFQPQLLAAVALRHWQEVPPWNTYMDENTPGNFHSDAPVLIIHGAADPVVPLEASVQLEARLCSNHTLTHLSVYPGQGHNATKYAMPEALQWAAARLAGTPATGDCSLWWSVYLPFVIR